jgi:SAM-dependent methyltransferase
MLQKINEKYGRFFTGEYLMGPNTTYLLNELLTAHPLRMNRDNLVLDLGCGKGLSSLFLANETGATVYANDLWITDAENRKRFEEWNMSDRIIPSHEDATRLSFDREMFDAIVSVDAYHYFAGSEGFFCGKILPFVKKGGAVLIAVPGVRAEYEGRQEELLGEWLGDEAHMLRSCGWWENIIGTSGDIRSLRTWEMKVFAPAWESWLATDNEYARGDKARFDSIVSRYTCFDAIEVIKK